MSLHALIHRQRPSWWQSFLESPSKTLAKTLYSKRLSRPSRPPNSLPITVVCVSDTHNTQPDVPVGDLLIHAGDLTEGGTAEEVQSQLDWINSQPHPHKIVIAGNHDIVLDEAKWGELGFSPADRGSLRWGSIVYLEQCSTKLEFPSGRSLTIYGSAWTRKHGNWAFQYGAGVDMFTDRVDDDVDILVTHSPPRYHLDLAEWGDEFLLKELWRTRPRLHVFGHIHGGHGTDFLAYDRFQDLYEQVCARRAGAVALIWMAVLLLWTWTAGANRHEKGTTLINASAIGGLTDKDKNKTHTIQL